MRPKFQSATMALPFGIQPVNFVWSVVVCVAAVTASGHAIIYKREPRSAALWVILIWLAPVAGPLLYLLLGINRVRRRAFALRGDMVHHRTNPEVTPCDLDVPL